MCGGLATVVVAVVVTVVVAVVVLVVVAVVVVVVLVVFGVVTAGGVVVDLLPQAIAATIKPSVIRTTVRTSTVFFNSLPPFLYLKTRVLVSRRGLTLYVNPLGTLLFLQYHGYFNAAIVASRTFSTNAGLWMPPLESASSR